MRRAVVLFACLLIACGPGKPVEECTCARAKLENEWCKACMVGYVAGLQMKSLLLWEELDAHGHKIDPKVMECATCRAAVEVDGFCERCSIGFVAKQAYLSRLSYYLAKGERKTAEAVTCESCRGIIGGRGWCAKCGVGWVGLVAMRDQADFERAGAAYERVQAAVKTAERCEVCAVAQVFDGRCPDCKIRYKGGKRVDAEGK